MPRRVKTKRGLNAERVVEVALRVADEDGIEAISLRRLASMLSVTPMAIYRHVRNKSHLLDLMAESLLEQLDLAPGGEATWQDRLRRQLGSYQAIVAAHPSMPLLLSRPLSAPAELRASEALLETLHRAGFDAAQSARVLQVMAGMLLGPAIHRATWAYAKAEPSDADGQDAQTQERSADAFPHLAVVGPLIDWSASAEADRLTLDLLIGGLEALAQRPGRR
jgi:AcrR family transcriptional regulator